MILKRRKFIHAGGATLVVIFGAGCQSAQRDATDQPSQHGVADISINNKTGAPKTISLSIHGYDEKFPGLQEKFTLGKNIQKHINNKIVMGDDYKVTVRVESGPKNTWIWNDVSGTMHINVYNNDIDYWTEADK